MDDWEKETTLRALKDGHNRLTIAAGTCNDPEIMQEILVLTCQIHNVITPMIEAK